MKITAGKKFDKNDNGRLLDIIKSWYTIIQRYYQSGKQYPEAVLNDLKASISGVLKDYGQAVGAASRIGKRRIMAADSYGWVVESWEAQEAYDMALEYGWDKADLDAEIVQGLSSDELAEAMAFIFRMNDFQEWNDRNGDSDSDGEKDWDEYDFHLDDAEVGFDYFDEEVEYFRENKDSMTEDDLQIVYEDAVLLKKQDIADEVSEVVESRFYGG